MTDNRTVIRDASQFQLANSVINTADDNAEQSAEPNKEHLYGVPDWDTRETEQNVENINPEPVVQINGDPGLDQADDTRRPPTPRRPPPTPQGTPGAITQKPGRNRKPPKYLEDYVC